MLYFSIQNSRGVRTGKVSEAAGARWRFYPRIILDYPRIILDYPRIILDYPRIVFILAEALEALLPEIFHFKIMWQAHTLVKVECDFMWQAQYLVKVECDFMWQAQYLVTFWEIAGAGNVVFFNTKLSRSSHGEGLRSGGCEMTILSSIILGLSSITLGLSSIILESSLYWRKHLRHFYLRSYTSRLCGRRSIWWRWSVTFRGRRSTSWHFGR